MTTIPQVEAVRQALPAVEQTARTFEAFDVPLSNRECEQAKTAAKMLESALEAVAAIMEQRGLGAIIHDARFYAMSVSLYYALEQGKEARLRLAVYTPNCGRTAERYLRQREVVARMFAAFAKAAGEMVQTAGTPTAQEARQAPQPQQSRRERPAYLRLVPTITEVASQSQEKGGAQV